MATNATGETFKGQVNSIATYRQPIVAKHSTGLVKLIATGDLQGRSPGCQFVDNNGKLHWDSLDAFQVIDTNLVSNYQQSTGMTSSAR